MVSIPSRMYRIKSPKGDVISVTWANARDLTSNAGYTHVKGEQEVLKDAQAEAAKNSYIEGNDPTKIDVDALQKHYEQVSAAKSVDEMTRDELVAHAEAHDVEIDKRWGSEKLVAAIKAVQDPPAEPAEAVA